MGHKGHWGEYTGNAKWSRDHAHTRVTSKNYDDAVKDDAAHIDYLKRDERVMYWRQQRNGMWIRAALFVYLFKKDDAILNLV